MNAQSELTDHLAALERLVNIAKGDSRQAKNAADFLMAWWDASELGGFDLTALWETDPDIVADMFKVMELVVATRSYPESFGYAGDFLDIIFARRPEVREAILAEERECETWNAPNPDISAIRICLVKIQNFLADVDFGKDQ